uniref:Uncharacterized protein n=1 Tax=Anguilla anguilla TaxID=7936 RepID=A0A0E9VTC0_ANGAN
MHTHTHTQIHTQAHFCLSRVLVSSTCR